MGFVLRGVYSLEPSNVGLSKFAVFSIYKRSIIDDVPFNRPLVLNKLPYVIKIST